MSEPLFTDAELRMIAFELAHSPACVVEGPAVEKVVVDDDGCYVWTFQYPALDECTCGYHTVLERVRAKARAALVEGSA